MDQASFSVSDDEVALRAYRIWEATGRPERRALEHWLQAEAQLRAECSTGKAATPSPVPAELGPTSPQAIRYGLVLKR